MANRDENENTGYQAGQGNAGESQGGSQGNQGTSRGRSGRSNRGFASMDTSKQREIASKGGRAAHAKGTAHEFNSDEARNAGRKGGQAVSRNREHMAAIGRKGGEARGAARRAASQGQAGANVRGAAQNSGARPGLTTDREVGAQGASQNTGGSGSSLGGETRRGASGQDARENTERI